MKRSYIKEFISLSIRICLVLCMAILIFSNCCCSHPRIDVTRDKGNSIPRIAIVEFINLHPIPEMREVEKRLAENLKVELQQTGRFIVVEQSQSDHILKEHHLSYEGITQTLNAGKRLPALEGLDYIVTGTLSGDSISTEVLVKFITARKPNAGTIAYTFTAKGITTPAILPLVRKLVASINTVFSPDEGTETKVAEAVPSVETLIGILPFQNYTADKSLDWIGKGIGASLTTTLSQLQGFRLVERQQLEQILSEQRLQASALFDPETVVESGRLWNTRYLILGGYQKLGDSYRLDGWRVDTETGRIFDARGIVGKDLFALQQELGERLREAIDHSTATIPKSPSTIRDITVGIRTVETIPTSVYHLLDTLQAPLVEYTLENTTRNNYKLSVSTEIIGYTYPKTDTVELSLSETRVVHQTPAFQPERLVALVQEQPAQLQMRITTLVEGSEQVIFEKQQNITLLPYNMLLWSIESADGQQIDLLPALSAWVSPNSPTVARLLREATDYAPSNRIAGYQNPALIAMPDSGETQTQRQNVVREEVRAIYQMLQERYQLRYVDQSTQYPNDQGQRILLPEEVLDYKSANCIDGTILMASLLYRAGIHPLIIIVPGHAFLGWEVWSDTGRYDVLETTQIGVGDFDTAISMGWKQAENASIATALRQGIHFGKMGEQQIGQAILLDVWTLKEKGRFAEIPLVKSNK